MSSDLYEVLSLAARYLFTLLGVLIVLRAFIWLLSDRAEKRRRLRSLPNAGMVGEMVVLSGGPDLPAGAVIPVPWEGVLGSVRSCDLCIPCPGVRKRHLSFSFHTGRGLLLHPFSGCEASVNQVPLTCGSRESDAPMTHGSLLRIGSVLLRLRLFAGLDPASGWEENPPFPVPPPDPGSAGNPPAGMAPAAEPAFIPGTWYEYASDPSTEDPSGTPGLPDAAAGARPSPAEENALTQEEAPSRRGRRSDRWEADWSD